MMEANLPQSNSSINYLKKYLLLIGPMVIPYAYVYLSPLEIDDGVIFWIIDILVYWLIPILSLYILWRLYGFSPQQYGLFKKTNKYLYSKKDLVTDIIIAIIGFWLVGNVSYWVTCGVSSSICSEGYFSNLDKYELLTYWLIKIYISATAAIFEEIYYRGILYNIFSGLIKKQEIMKILYVGLSSFLFALFHFEHQMAGLVSAFFLAIFAGIFYLHSKRLEPIIIGHFILNITA